MLVQIHMSKRAQAQYPAFARSFDGVKGTFKRSAEHDKIDFNSKEYITIDISNPKEEPKKTVWLTVTSNWLRPVR